MILRTASKLPKIRRCPVRMKSSVNANKEIFEDPNLFLTESELQKKASRDPFSLPRSSKPQGAFERALDSKNDNIYDQARSDYIYRYGRAQPDADLVRAYLRQEKDADPNPLSALSLKAFGLKETPGDPLLEARLLEKQLPPKKGIKDRSPYAQSLLAELIEHPLLNADIGAVLDLDDEEREARVKQLEEFYGKSVQELLAFMEFKRAKEEIQKVSRQGAHELGKGHGPGLVNENIRSNLEFFESDGLERFFDPKPEPEKKKTESFLEMKTPDQKKIQQIKDELSNRKSKMEEIISESVDIDSFEKSSKISKYAYDIPRPQYDKEKKIYNHNFENANPEPERKKFRPRQLEKRENFKLAADEKRTDSIKSMRLSELMDRLKAGDNSDDNLLELYREIYNRLDIYDCMNYRSRTVVTDEQTKMKRKREDGWITQEMIRSRIALESTGFWALDQIRYKGAFSQLDGYKAGVGLEEQIAVGSLHFTDNQSLKKAQKRLKESEFRRNLKRRIEEFLQERGISDLSKRKELFLAIEKAADLDEYPARELNEVQNLALLSHPFSFDFLSVLTKPKVIDKISISDPELLESFIRLVEKSSPSTRAAYSDFFQIFNKKAVTVENLKRVLGLLELIESEQQVTGATTFWLKRILTMHSYNVLGQSDKFDSKMSLQEITRNLKSLEKITASYRNVLNMPIISQKLTETAAKSLFFANLWVNYSATDSLRLILLANSVWNVAERFENPSLLLLQFMSTFETEILRRVFSDQMVAAMKKSGLKSAADRVTRAVDFAIGLVEQLDADPLFEYQASDNLFVVDQMFFDFDVQCFVAGGRPLMKDFRRPLRNLETAEYKRLQSVIECMPTTKKLRQYDNLHSFYKRRNGTSLPAIFNSDGRLCEVTLQKNLSILNDFYSLNVKRKVFDSDYDENQRFRTTGVRWKLDGKGLVRNTVVSRNFSKVKKFENLEEIRKNVKRKFSDDSWDENNDTDMIKLQLISQNNNKERNLSESDQSYKSLDDNILQVQEEAFGKKDSDREESFSKIDFSDEVEESEDDEDVGGLRSTQDFLVFDDFYKKKLEHNNGYLDDQFLNDWAADRRKYPNKRKRSFTNEVPFTERLKSKIDFTEVTLNSFDLIAKKTQRTRVNRKTIKEAGVQDEICKIDLLESEIEKSKLFGKSFFFFRLNQIKKKILGLLRYQEKTENYNNINLAENLSEKIKNNPEDTEIKKLSQQHFMSFNQYELASSYSLQLKITEMSDPVIFFDESDLRQNLKNLGNREIHDTNSIVLIKDIISSNWMTQPEFLKGRKFVSLFSELLTPSADIDKSENELGELFGLENDQLKKIKLRIRQSMSDEYDQVEAKIPGLTNMSESTNQNSAASIAEFEYRKSALSESPFILYIISMLSQKNLLPKLQHLILSHNIHYAEIALPKCMHQRLKTLVKSPHFLSINWNQMFFSSLLKSDVNREELMSPSLERSKDLDSKTVVKNIQSHILCLAQEIWESENDALVDNDPSLKKSIEKIKKDINAIEHHFKMIKDPMKKYEMLKFGDSSKNFWSSINHLLEKKTAYYEELKNVQLNNQNNRSGRSLKALELKFIGQFKPNFVLDLRKSDIFESFLPRNLDKSLVLFSLKYFSNLRQLPKLFEICFPSPKNFSNENLTFENSQTKENLDYKSFDEISEIEKKVVSNFGWTYDNKKNIICQKQQNELTEFQEEKEMLGILMSDKEFQKNLEKEITSTINTENLPVVNEFENSRLLELIHPQTKKFTNQNAQSKALELEIVEEWREYKLLIRTAENLKKELIESKNFQDELRNYEIHNLFSENMKLINHLIKKFSRARDYWKVEVFEEIDETRAIQYLTIYHFLSRIMNFIENYESLEEIEEENQMHFEEFFILSPKLMRDVIIKKFSFDPLRKKSVESTELIKFLNREEILKIFQ